MQALSERYRGFRRDRGRRDAGCLEAVIGRRQATNRAPISSRIGKKPKVLKRYFWGSTSETTAGRVTTDGQPPMRSAGLMPKSRLEKVAKCLSTTIGDRWSLPGCRGRQPAEATCHARSASIGDF